MVRPNDKGTLRMLLKQEKMDFEIMIDEVNKLVSNQMAEIVARRKGEQSIGIRLDNFDYNVYHTYDEVNDKIYGNLEYYINFIFIFERQLTFIKTLSDYVNFIFSSKCEWY